MYGIAGAQTAVRDWLWLTIYSTDPADCEKYNFKYNNMFYCEKYYEPYEPCKKNKLFFLGVDKGRADLLLCLKAVFEESGIECDIRLLASGLNKKRRQLTSVFLMRNT